MGKLLYSATMSLDGFIAGPGGDMSWLARSSWQRGVGLNSALECTFCLQGGREAEESKSFGLDRGG